MADQNFNMVLSGVPYTVKISPFDFNSEKRYKVTYNGGDEHIFTWDSSMGRYAAIDDDSATIPDELEVAISEKLVSVRA